MKVSRLAIQSLNRRLERSRWNHAISLVAATAALSAALSGCQSQQANPGDPFLPFMRSRVTPPGTNAPVDPYYQGGAGTTAPPANAMPQVTGGSPATGAPPANYPPQGGFAPPATTAPAAAPMSPGQPDKYSPAGGFNWPQSSIDRSKAVAPVSGEVKAGGTALARRSRPKTAGGQPADDALAAGGAASTATLTAGGNQPADQNTPGTDNLAASDAADEQQAGSAATMAFADAPGGGDAGSNETGTSEPGSADRSGLVATAGHWSGGNAPGADQPSGGNTSLRIIDHDQPETGTADPTAVAMSNDSGREPLEETSPSAGGQASPIDTGIFAHPKNLASSSDDGGGSGVVQASWNEPAAPAGRAAASAGAQSYGYDPAYGWLRGRLEYSASQRQWKLRYIPIDGTTDQFGGSVVLADGTQTRGLRAGDFVVAQGRVVAASQTGRGFSPRYEVASIQSSSTN